MILIVSQGYLDEATEAVMDWLREKRVEFIRLNGEDLCSSTELEIDFPAGEMKIRLADGSGDNLDLSKISAVWFRRWHFKTPAGAKDPIREEISHSFKASTDMMEHLSLERERLSEFIFRRLDHACWLSRPACATLDKLYVLEEAQSCGLDIPLTLVTTRKAPLLDFFSACGAVITKPISEMPMYRVAERLWSLYTTELDGAQVNSLPERFFPSMFQEKLDRKYEIRSFYLDDRLFSMAIIPGSGEENHADVRRAECIATSRFVPYKLPDSVHDNVCRFMQQLSLETGSLDIIKTISGRYVFLDVNPVGNFDMVSGPCNYGLEKKVAEALIKRSV